jgi:type IV pilus assembly protein PilM
MASSNICWGIELGASAIKAIKLERSGDEVKVLEYAVIPHKKTLSTPDADPADTLRVSMGQLVSQFDLSGAQIAIGIPGHSAFARFAKLPPVEPKKIPDIVKFEAVQQIPFPIDQVEWDYQTFMSPDNPDVEVGIFAVMREKITDILAKWAELGVTPDYVTLGPVAVYNAISFDQNFNDKTPGTVILDIGTTSTDLLVCEPGRVWVRTFQIGGHQFTESLVNAFKLSYSKAETLKAHAEQSTHARHVLQAMRPVFSDLAQEVQRSIGYYQSSHKDANLTRLIALGSTVNLPGLRKYLSQQLQMEVIRPEKFNRATVDGARGAEFEAATPNLATAYGLALQGLGFSHGIMVNLMPTAIVREGLWKKKTKWFAAAAGLSIAAGAIAFFRPINDKLNTEAQNKPAEVTSVANTINQLKGKWKEVEGTFKPDFRAANIALLLNNRDVYPHLVNDTGLIMHNAAEIASKEAEPKPGLTFMGMRTTYVGPAAADPGAPAPDPKTGANMGRVQVELDLQTTREDADRFITASVSKWLHDNADRPGVPYTIDKGTIAWNLDRKVMDKAAGGNDPDPNAGGAPPPSSMPSPGGRRGLGAGPSGGMPSDRGLSGGGNWGGGSLDPSGGGQSNANLDQLAPLPLPPAPAEPGKTLFTFKVRFDAVIRPPASPETKS